MSDDLRAAAKLIVEWNRTASAVRCGCGRCVVCQGVERRLAALSLANGWITEHPADDAEPVIAEWLESTGWELYDARPGWRKWKKVVCVQRHGYGDGFTTHWLDIHEPCEGADGSVWWPINFWQQHSAVDAKPDGVAILSWVDHTTRGHVRRLLAALGVTREGG